MEQKKLEKHIVGENSIGYTLGEDDIYYPDLKIDSQEEYSLGKYARIAKKHLRENHNDMYTCLLWSGTLNQFLHELEEEYEERMDILIEQMKEQQGVTEQLKAENQLLWVQMMNQMKASAEEIVLQEMVYV